MPDTSVLDPLEAELIALGRTLVVDPPSADLADLVLARLAETDDGYAARPRSRTGPAFATWLGALWAPRRRAAVAAIAALLVVVLVPPVRAAVLELFRIGGVTVREVPAPPDLGAPTGPTGTTATGSVVVDSLEEASGRMGFEVGAPPQLGPPTTIALTREGRVVELTWGAGPTSTRLDVFKGSLSFGYLKSVWDAVEPTNVGGQEAVWFEQPHLIEWIDRSGRTQSSPPRVAGPTLVWVERLGGEGEITYRLEGPTTLDAARAIAQSVP
jgi:hypothetical protein